VKQREESAVAFEAGKRPELAARERAEIVLIREFMPRQMDEAEIRAALRHRLQQQGEQPIFRSGDLSVDLVRRIVRVGGQDVKLSPKEYDILRMLVAHAGKVLTHRMLLAGVWGGETDVQYLRIYIRQLRQKLETDPEQPQHILTETGVGYRLKMD
jgi:two-component system KDP operon response regulator KdpE